MYIHSVKNKQYRCTFTTYLNFRLRMVSCILSVPLYVGSRCFFESKNQFIFECRVQSDQTKNLHFFFKELNNARIVCWVLGTRSAISCLIADTGQYLRTLLNNFVKVEDECFLYSWRSTFTFRKTYKCCILFRLVEGTFIVQFKKKNLSRIRNFIAVLYCIETWIYIEKDLNYRVES